MTKPIPYLLLAALSTVGSAQVIAIKAGHLIDPETGSVAANQIILVDAGKFTAIGSNVAIPPNAEVIDLAQYYVSPGLVDAHNHLALTYKKDPENNSYYVTTVMDSTAIRAVQAVSNGRTMLNSGFTVARDLGNAGNYADTALRVAIEQGWIPGPTMIKSAIIIGGMGGQFSPVPERASLVYPEYHRDSCRAHANWSVEEAALRDLAHGPSYLHRCAGNSNAGGFVGRISAHSPGHSS